MKEDTIGRPPITSMSDQALYKENYVDNHSDESSISSMSSIDDLCHKTEIVMDDSIDVNNIKLENEIAVDNNITTE